MTENTLLLTPTDPISAPLAVRDPELGALMQRVGRIELGEPPEPFSALIRSIVGQQLSEKAATTIWNRLVATVPPDPAALVAAAPETLRAAGLSRAKTSYVIGIAHAALTGAVDFAELHELSDDEVIEKLTALKGVGRWTAEMYLIFALRRPDVLALDDLGVRASAGKMLGLGRTATREELAERGELWRPHRTVASLWLWADLG